MSIFSNLGGGSAKSRNLFILLIVLSLSLITYVLIKALVRLYKEHKETEAPVRKVWDTEAAQEAETTADGVNSLPPIVSHSFPHDKQPVELYRTPVPGQDRPFMPVANDTAILPYQHPTHHQLEQYQHHHHQPPLFLRWGSEITRSQQQSLPAPSACSTPPRGLVEAADKPYMQRKPLWPLSVEDLERRRVDWCRRPQGHRAVGKENIAPVDPVVGT